MLLSFRSAVFVSFLGVAGSMMACSSELCVKVNDELALPLSGSWITVTELGKAKTQSRLVDEKGRACVKVAEGVYSVEAGHFGYLNVRYYPIRVLVAKPLLDIVMRLPVGDITEGEIGQDSVLSGTVLLEDRPVQSGEVCVLQKQSHVIVSCGVTDEFGEYVISVTPGKYDVEVRTPQGLHFSSDVDISTPGLHRDRIVIPLK